MIRFNFHILLIIRTNFHIWMAVKDLHVHTYVSSAHIDLLHLPIIVLIINFHLKLFIFGLIDQIILILIVLIIFNSYQKVPIIRI